MEAPPHVPRGQTARQMGTDGPHSRKPVESPPVAAFPPPRCVGVRVPRGTPRFAPASRPVDADRVDTACQLGRQCRDLSHSIAQRNPLGFEIGFRD